MNALATDQAARLAEAIHSDERLRGKVTAGLFIGTGIHKKMVSNEKTGTQKDLNKTMGEHNIIENIDDIIKNPPDILLTNFKMLDYSFIRSRYNKIWKFNLPKTSTTAKSKGADKKDFENPLKFLVLDEIHTYDGVQGTDVAHLIRRLKLTLGIKASGSLCPIGTSATVGDKGGKQALCNFASKIFGEKFTEEDIVGETREDIENYIKADNNNLIEVPTCRELFKTRFKYHNNLKVGTGVVDTYILKSIKTWFTQFLSGEKISNYSDEILVNLKEYLLDENTKAILKKINAQEFGESEATTEGTSYFNKKDAEKEIALNLNKLKQDIANVLPTYIGNIKIAQNLVSIASHGPVSLMEVIQKLALKEEQNDTSYNSQFNQAILKLNNPKFYLLLLADLILLNYKQEQRAIVKFLESLEIDFEAKDAAESEQSVFEIFNKIHQDAFELFYGFLCKYVDKDLVKKLNKNNCQNFAEFRKIIWEIVDKDYKDLDFSKFSSEACDGFIKDLENVVRTFGNINKFNLSDVSIKSKLDEKSLNSALENLLKTLTSISCLADFGGISNYQNNFITYSDNENEDTESKNKTTIDQDEGSSQYSAYDCHSDNLIEAAIPTTILSLVLNAGDDSLVLNAILSLISLFSTATFEPKVEDERTKRRSLVAKEQNKVSVKPLPFLYVQVQLWLRELRGILRFVDKEPRFIWCMNYNEDVRTNTGIALPMYYCSHCGKSGVISYQNEAQSHLFHGRGLSVVEQINMRMFKKDRNLVLVNLDKIDASELYRCADNADLDNTKDFDVIELNKFDLSTHVKLSMILNKKAKYDNAESVENTLIDNSDTDDNGILATASRIVKKDEFLNTCIFCGKERSIVLCSNKTVNTSSILNDQTMASDFGCEFVKDIKTKAVDKDSANAKKEEYLVTGWENERERKTLTFTNKTQDAAFLAANYESHSYRFFLRQSMQQFLNLYLARNMTELDCLFNEDSDEPIIASKQDFIKDSSNYLSVEKFIQYFIKYWKYKLKNPQYGIQSFDNSGISTTNKHKLNSEDAFYYAFLPTEFSDLDLNSQYREYENAQDEVGRLSQVFKDELEQRLRSDILSEFGLTSAVGRSLEKNATAGTYFKRDDLEKIYQAFVDMSVSSSDDELSSSNNVAYKKVYDKNATSSENQKKKKHFLIFLQVFLNRLRTHGAITHAYLDRYCKVEASPYALNEPNFNKQEGQKRHFLYKKFGGNMSFPIILAKETGDSKHSYIKGNENIDLIPNENTIGNSGENSKNKHLDKTWWGRLYLNVLAHEGNISDILSACVESVVELYATLLGVLVDNGF